MFYMLTIFATLCILAVVALLDAWLFPTTSEVPTVNPTVARIRAAANRFGAAVPTRTLNTAIHIARLAHDIASEPRAALLWHVPGASFAEEAQRLSVHASAAREDLPGLLARFAGCPSSPILDEIVTEIVERR